MKKVLFIDRDGTLVVEPPLDKQLDSLEKLEFYPGVFYWLSKITRELDYELVMVTNQDGLGTPSFPEHRFWPAHNKILQAFRNEGIVFSEVIIDRSFAHENRPTRKPGTALLSHFIKGNYNMADSYVIGDRTTDVELAANLGCKSVFIGNRCDAATLATSSWSDIYNHLAGQPRTATVVRKTNETCITVKLNLDGTGNSAIMTGLGFFNHMLDQLARHGNVDLYVTVAGDLQVDEHHTIEDTALVLGEAFLQALASKKGVERYGFLLPMDDCLAQVAIDFGGRPWLVWDANFNREKIGDMPTEMFMHFFKSFSDAARCNLNIKADGSNEHHKIEAIFKAFAKAIKMAVQQTGNYAIPTTKGIL